MPLFPHSYSCPWTSPHVTLSHLRHMKSWCLKLCRSHCWLLLSPLDTTRPSKAICSVCRTAAAGWKRWTSLGCPYSSVKGHRRTQDYSLGFLSWLLHPGPVIPILIPFQENLSCSLRPPAIQGSTGGKPLRASTARSECRYHCRETALWLGKTHRWYAAFC